MWKEFKEFAVKGNAIDLAVGVIVGAAFGSIVTSLVKDIIMPPIGLLTGGLDFSNKFIVLKAAKDGSMAFNTPADAVKAGAVTWMPIAFSTADGVPVPKIRARRSARDHARCCHSRTASSCDEQSRPGM